MVAVSGAGEWYPGGTRMTAGSENPPTDATHFPIDGSNALAAPAFESLPFSGKLWRAPSPAEGALRTGLTLGMRHRYRLDRRALGASAALLLALLVGAAHAQVRDYPSRTIRIIVPSAHGGAGDSLARYIGDRLASALRTPVTIENRPGASGLIGNDYAMHAAPDGYTLLFATSATHVITAFTMERLPYDPQRDFTPVINVVYATSVLVVSSALPVTTLREFIDYARSRPHALYYASSGVGSANHVDTEVFRAVADIPLIHIPYRGTADGYRALIADEVQLMFGAVTSALPHVQAGSVRALAVLTAERSPVLPDVPTLSEAGLPGVDVRKWLGLVAPAGTPPEIVARLNRALNGILRESEVRAWMDRQGLEVAAGAPEDFDRALRADLIKWEETVRKLGLRPE
jgi:tripartite-type tricarboxylate transporter receptor subunit TctC